MSSFVRCRLFVRLYPNDHQVGVGFVNGGDGGVVFFIPQLGDIGRFHVLVPLLQNATEPRKDSGGMALFTSYKL